MDDRQSPRDSVKSSLAELRLLHLADSAFPIGSLAHSFGLESLVDSGRLAVADLPAFFSGYLEEAGVLESVFFRAAFSLAQDGAENFSEETWLEWNDRLSALKPAREAREGSAVLGENLLNAVLAMEDLPVVRRALESARQRRGHSETIRRSGFEAPPTPPHSQTIGRGGFETRPAVQPPILSSLQLESRDGRRTLIHHSLAFGLAAGALHLDPERAVFAYLHQSMASLVSACQRLMPLGQTNAARILWHLKPAIVAAAKRSAECRVDDARSFTPLLDWGAMEHPSLTTRLFIS